MAKGELIGFVDSDDYIEKNMYEVLYNNIRKYNADISMCGFKKIYDDKEADGDVKRNLILTGKKKSEYLADTGLYAGNVVMWNKIFRRKFFNSDMFPINLIHEDIAIIPRLIYYARKVVITKEPLYNYYQSPESITRCKYNISRLDEFTAIEDNIDFFKSKKEDEIVELFKIYMLERYIFHYFNAKEFLGNSIEHRCEIRKRHRHDFILIKKNRGLIFNLRHISFIISPSLYLPANKWLKIIERVKRKLKIEIRYIFDMNRRKRNRIKRNIKRNIYRICETKNGIVNTSNVNTKLGHIANKILKMINYLNNIKNKIKKVIKNFIDFINIREHIKSSFKKKVQKKLLCIKEIDYVITGNRKIDKIVKKIKEYEKLGKLDRAQTRKKKLVDIYIAMYIEEKSIEKSEEIRLKYTQLYKEIYEYNSNDLNLIYGILVLSPKWYGIIYKYLNMENKIKSIFKRH
jgi:hypothetical protein